MYNVLVILLQACVIAKENICDFSSFFLRFSDYFGLISFVVALVMLLVCSHLWPVDLPSAENSAFASLLNLLCCYAGV